MRSTQRHKLRPLGLDGRGGGDYKTQGERASQHKLRPAGCVLVAVARHHGGAQGECSEQHKLEPAGWVVGADGVVTPRRET